jgi:hypothetical protein
MNSIRNIRNLLSKLEYSLELETNTLKTLQNMCKNTTTGKMAILNQVRQVEMKVAVLKAQTDTIKFCLATPTTNRETSTGVGETNSMQIVNRQEATTVHMIPPLPLDRLPPKPLSKEDCIVKTATGGVNVRGTIRNLSEKFYKGRKFSLDTVIDDLRGMDIINDTETGVRAANATYIAMRSLEQAGVIRQKDDGTFATH